MKLYLRLAWRNLWRHRRRTLIVVVAMAMGLGLMMLYDGLMAGFDQAIYGNAIKVLGGNIQIHAEGYRTETGRTRSCRCRMTRRWCRPPWPSRRCSRPPGGSTPAGWSPARKAPLVSTSPASSRRKKPTSTWLRSTSSPAAT